MLLADSDDPWSHEAHLVGTTWFLHIEFSTRLDMCTISIDGALSKSLIQKETSSLQLKLQSNTSKTDTDTSTNK